MLIKNFTRVSLQNSWKFEDFARNNLKYETLKNVGDQSVLDKHSLSWKIFSSVLYDLAKSIVPHCKSMDRSGVSPFMDHCFKHWWDNTPILIRLHAEGYGVDHGGVHLKLRTYARNRTRSILSVMLRKNQLQQP